MKCLIRGARLSFPDLFEATTVNGQGKPSFRAQLLVPETGGDAKASVDGGATWGPAKQVIEQAIAATAKDKWAAKAPQIIAANEGIPQKHCFIDGRKRSYEGYEGNWALSASRPEEKGRPLVFDQQKNPLVAADGKPYAGCYVNASVEFWAQDNQHGKAVRCSLNGVQFARDGDAFAGGAPASPDDFEALAEGADAGDLA
jgi:hypothetical protein